MAYNPQHIETQAKEKTGMLGEISGAFGTAFSTLKSITAFIMPGSMEVQYSRSKMPDESIETPCGVGDLMKDRMPLDLVNNGASYLVSSMNAPSAPPATPPVANLPVQTKSNNIG